MNRYKSMTLYLTLDCNLKCYYCFCGKKYKDNMSIETAGKAIAFFNDVCNERGDITFFGGEPLLRMDLIKQIVALCKDNYPNKFTFSITTNGLLLTKENYRFLSENDIYVLLSLDGNKEAQDHNRPTVGGNGSWDVIMRNIEDIGVYLPIRMTVSRKTLPLLTENIISLHKMGFHNIAFYLAAGEPWKEEDFIEFEKQIIRLTEYLWECYERADVLNIHWIDKEIGMYIADHGNKCNMGLHQFSVTPDGSIYPCNHTNFENARLCLGNIYEGFDEEKVSWLRTELERSDPECEGCKLLSRCNCCNMDRYDETGNLWQAPDWFCTANQIVIKQADLLASRLYKERNSAFMKKFYGTRAEKI